jgi:hypothetical protein
MDIMRARPLAGYGALIICTLTLVACGVREIAVPFSQPAPKASVNRSWALPHIGLPGFGNGSGMPAEEAQCRRRLKRLGVSFRDLAPIREGASCGIDYPVQVTSLARGVKLTPAATLTCDMAEELARWTQGDLAPAARGRYLSGIAEISNGSSYSCRRVRGSGSWSQHSKGKAIDIGAIKLKNGRIIEVERQGVFAFRARGLLKSVRGGACQHFSTVLGPGYDRDHRNHFHFDLKDRRNGRSFCR